MSETPYNVNIFTNSGMPRSGVLLMWAAGVHTCVPWGSFQIQVPFLEIWITLLTQLPDYKAKTERVIKRNKDKT
jgi:hypothetical protein